MELPDLEVLAGTLEELFKNKTLEKLDVVVGKKLNVSEKELKDALEGHKLLSVEREGKTLEFHFGGGNVLGLHLMLHGEIRLLEKEKEVKYQILNFHFKGGDGFSAVDFQKQARPTLNPEKSESPDAFSRAFSADYLKQVLAKKKVPVKQVLMDQKIVRGIGNAYADEILWEAKISPFSVSNAVPGQQVEELHQAIDNVLRKAIIEISKQHPKEPGAEVRDFLKVHGSKLKKSPGGAEIKIGVHQGRKAYYTDEQKLYQ